MLSLRANLHSKYQSSAVRFITYLFDLFSSQSKGERKPLPQGESSKFAFQGIRFRIEVSYLSNFPSAKRTFYLKPPYTMLHEKSLLKLSGVGYNAKLGLQLEGIRYEIICQCVFPFRNIYLFSQIFSFNVSIILIYYLIILENFITKIPNNPNFKYQFR